MREFKQTQFNKNEVTSAERSRMDKNVRGWLLKKYNKGNVNNKPRLDKSFLEVPSDRSRMIRN